MSTRRCTSALSYVGAPVNQGWRCERAAAHIGPHTCGHVTWPSLPDLLPAAAAAVVSEKRRSAARRRSEQISLRVRPAEAEALRALAAERGVTVQEVIRQMVAAHAARNGNPSPLEVAS